MKNRVRFFLLLLPIIGFSQENNNKPESGINFSINCNGIAPIPAFSLGKPAAMASASIKIGRLGYSPTLAYALDIKPWYIDNWFHYRVVLRPKFELKAGVNFCTILTNFKLPGAFYINYDGMNDGLCFSPTFSITPNKLPLSLFLQATQAISSNIPDLQVFRWNVGLSYSL